VIGIKVAADSEEGRYRKATLIERYGPESEHGSTLRLELAAGCPKIAAGKDVRACGVYYLDPRSG
jgi:hypothetical protein